MSDQLSPKELARIKRIARKRRITTIRKRVAVLGISLAALFSGAVLVRSQIGQPAVGQSTPTSRLAMVTGGNAGSGSGVSDDHGSDDLESDDLESDDLESDDLESDDLESDEEGSSGSDIGSAISDTGSTIANAATGLIGGGQSGSSGAGAAVQSAPAQSAPLVTSQS